ncbi:hypothetical protein T484DRAFT_3516839 [Baffinella frigidus]|nr:hypothetical protein T484DRAFT_3516839 [Cryptophyta sp. CCMP2293]
MPKIIGALSIFRGNTFDCQDAVGKLQCSTIRRLLCIAHDLLQDACTRGEGVGEAAETCQEAVLAARTAYGDLGISCEFAVEDPAKMLQLLRESGKYEVLVDRSQQRGARHPPDGDQSRASSIRQWQAEGGRGVAWRLSVWCLSRARHGVWRCSHRPTQLKRCWAWGARNSWRDTCCASGSQQVHRRASTDT